MKADNVWTPLIAVVSTFIACGAALSAGPDCVLERCGPGRSVWFNYPSLDFCRSVQPKNCERRPFGSKFTILSTEFIDGLPYYKVKDSTGSVGYLFGGNDHLYLTIDPRPSAEAKKKKEADDKVRMEKKKQEDEEILQNDPTPHEKACILSAALNLPKIPGIEILKSEIIPPPPEVAPSPGVLQRIVRISVRAAGQDVTYSYFCGKGVSTPAFVHLLEQK